MEKRIKQADLTFEIKKAITSKASRIGIVGGHYLLLFDDTTNSLKPAVYQEQQNVKNRLYCKGKAGDFPVDTFQKSINLYSSLIKDGWSAKGVLLVNDDSISETLPHGEGIEKIDTTVLRRDYFKSKFNIPSTFNSILLNAGIRLEDYFEQFKTDNFSEQGYLPKESIFISERRLCKRFKKLVKKAEPNNIIKRIIKIEGKNAEITEFAYKQGNNDTVCLIREGICQCGGKAFQFYYDLIKHGFDTIIFFVPENCLSQVRIAIDLICSHSEFENKQIKIITIFGLDDSDFLNINIVKHGY